MLERYARANSPVYSKRTLRLELVAKSTPALSLNRCEGNVDTEENVPAVDAVPMSRALVRHSFFRMVAARWSPTRTGGLRRRSHLEQPKRFFM